MLVILQGVLVRYGALLTALVFSGFFGLAVLALVFRDRAPVRPLFCLFVVTLVLGSSLTAIQPIPVVNANEYTAIAPERNTHYGLRVVDEDGKELPYDPKAMRPNLQNEELAENIGKEQNGSEKTQISYTRAERTRVAAFLLREAREYRQDVQAGSNPLELFSFPPHHVRGHWSAAELRNYSEFVGVRVYRMEVTFRDGGRETVVTDSNRVYEYRPTNTTSR